MRHSIGPPQRGVYTRRVHILFFGNRGAARSLSVFPTRGTGCPPLRFRGARRPLHQRLVGRDRQQISAYPGRKKSPALERSSSAVSMTGSITVSLIAPPSNAHTKKG